MYLSFFNWKKFVNVQKVTLELRIIWYDNYQVL